MFKKKGVKDSFRFPVSKSSKSKKLNIEIDNRRVKLPKIGWVGFFKSKNVEGAIKNVTVSRRGKHWFVSVQVEQNIVEPVHFNKMEVGIDLGVAKFATLSNKTKILPINSGKKLKKQIAKQQRILFRKVKFSSNWKRQKKCINKLHQKVKNRRNDFLHKISSKISKNHAIIYLENLKIRNMSRSAKGTKESPGKNIRAKSGLNRSMLDQGWYEFRKQLEYKALWNGGEVAFVDPKNTSRKCPHCGFTYAKNRKTQASFVCLCCGFSDDADYVAALNILAAGQRKRAVLACGETTLVASMKQEPVKDREIMSPQQLH